MMNRRLLLIGGGLALAAVVTLTAWPALAQSLSVDLGQKTTGSASGRMIQIIALMTVLSLAPSVLVMVTSFTRIVVVLSFLRSALGTQQSPPNTVMISLALFLTGFIMAPVIEKSYTEGVTPLVNQQIDEITAFKRITEPFQGFMMAHVREHDLELFADLAKLPKLEDGAMVPLHVLIPAFMISELRRAFEIGFLLFLPFLIIDMVVASILMSMGMMMLPPATISLPFKIIFFVLVDGWYLVAGSLVKSYSGT